MATATIKLDVTVDVELGKIDDIDTALESAKKINMGDILKGGKVTWNDGKKPVVVSVFSDDWCGSD